MEGVVCLLDAPHTALVEGLWRELAGRFGVRRLAAAVPHPHVSLHVASRYDRPALEELLARETAGLAPIRLRATGFGVFPGPEPVLYVPVVRDRALTALHADLWPKLAAVGEGSVPYYAPARWLPHITLAQGDLDRMALAAVAAHLAARPIDWEFGVDQFAVIERTPAGGQLAGRYSLGRAGCAGPSPRPPVAP